MIHFFRLDAFRRPFGTFGVFPALERNEREIRGQTKINLTYRFEFALRNKSVVPQRVRVAEIPFERALRINAGRPREAMDEIRNLRGAARGVDAGEQQVRAMF